MHTIVWNATFSVDPFHIGILFKLIFNLYFRTCCFNYLRKRSDPGVMVKTLAPPIDVTTFSVSAKPMDIPHDQHLQAELKAFKEEQKTRTQSFIAQLQRFFFGQISAFLYVQLLESRRFYDMMQVSDGHSLAAATVVSSSPRET